MTIVTTISFFRAAGYKTDFLTIWTRVFIVLTYFVHIDVFRIVITWSTGDSAKVVLLLLYVWKI